MRSKTVIAMAVAGALSIPLGTFAHETVEVRTPLSVNEAGNARVQQRQDDRLMRDHRAFMSERSWQVNTPLSIPEAGAADAWPGQSAHAGIPERDSLASDAHGSDVTTLSRRESSTFGSPHDEMSADSFPERSASSASESQRERLALADRGVYSDYYLIGVPQAEGADYFIVELQPQPQPERPDVTVFVPVE